MGTAVSLEAPPASVEEELGEVKKSSDIFVFLDSFGVDFAEADLEDIFDDMGAGEEEAAAAAASVAAF